MIVQNAYSLPKKKKMKEKKVEKHLHCRQDRDLLKGSFCFKRENTWFFAGAIKLFVYKSLSSAEGSILHSTCIVCTRCIQLESVLSRSNALCHPKNYWRVCITSNDLLCLNVMQTSCEKVYKSTKVASSENHIYMIYTTMYAQI
jgi:hypothetical protein